MQVELAALVYQRSRLVRSWTHLERQRGGFGFMGGPGEAQIETDRRLISDRIAKLRRELADVRRTRTLHRDARRRVPYPVVCLIGYTNAGKSTLFNRLTDADVSAKDQLFATLDPTMRGITLPSGRRAILSDTVGFISDLPHELVEAFRATLEEVTSADVLLHVRDVSSADNEAQRDDVLAVLKDLGLGDDPEGNLIEVLNKIDCMSDEDHLSLANRSERSNRPFVLLSAKTGDGCADLIDTLDEWLGAAMRVVDVELAPEDGADLAWIYRHGEVVTRNDEATTIRLTVRMADAELERYRRRRQQGTNGIQPN
jgi:GTP-binding protein HflX